MVRSAKSSPTLVCFLALATTLGLSLSANAATLLWDGDPATAGQQDGGGNWNTTDTNRWFNQTTPGYQAWSNATPDSAIIGVNTATTGTKTITLDTPITAHDIEFRINSESSYVVTGTTINKLTLSGPDAPELRVTLINPPTSTPPATPPPPGTASITGVIAGTQGFIKTGNGQLTLGGAAANEYTGLTTVSNGILRLDKNAGINAINNDIDIIGTGILQLGKANQIANTASITLNGGTLWLGSNAETIANLTLNSGTSNGGSGSNGGTFTVTDTLYINNNHSLGTNSGSNWTANRVVITGTGQVLSMTGNSTTGLSQFTIGSGGLSITGNRSFNLNTGTLANSFGTQINLNGDVTADGNISFVKNGTNTAGAAQINHGSSTRTWQIATGTTTNIGITIVGAGGLTKTGNGTLILSGDATTANTYAGLTTLNGGTIKLSKGTTDAPVISIAGDITVTSGILDWDVSNQVADTATINLNGGSLKFDSLGETIRNLNQSDGSVNNLGNSNGGSVTITEKLLVSGGSSINLNSSGVWSANTVEFTSSFAGNAIVLNGNAPAVLNRFVVGSGGLTLNGTVNTQTIALGRGTVNASPTPNGLGSELVLGGSFTGSGNVNLNISGAGTVGVAQVNLDGGQRTFNITSGTTTSNLSIVSNTVTSDGVGAVATAGGITKTGIGVLALTTANTYTGNTIINQGTLRLTVNGSLVSPRITVATSAIYDVAAVAGGYTLTTGKTLEGGGQVLGNVTIASGATLSGGTVSGDVTQTLAFAAGLTLNSGSTTFLDLGTPADFDKLTVASAFNQATGAVITVNGNGFIPVAGQTYQLVSFGSTSTFSTNLGPLFRTGAEDNATDLNLPDISASGLQWNVSLFTQNGTISITPEPSRALLLLAGIVATLLPRRRRRRL